MNYYPCGRCEFSTRHFRKMVFHQRHVHSHEHDFSVTCSVQGCQKSFCAIGSLIKHIKRKHRVFFRENLSKNRNAIPPEAPFNSQSDDESDTNSISNNTEVHGLTCSVEENQDNRNINFIQLIAKLLLRIREEYKLPAAAIAKVADEVGSIANVQQLEIHQKIRNILQNGNVDDHITTEILSLLNSFTPIEDACSSLNSSKKLNRYTERTFGLVKPVEYILGRSQLGKIKTMQYIPVIETLQCLLKHDDVFSFIVNSHDSGNDYLADICDGQVVKKNNFFQNGTLQILLFFDEFTIVNPLGTQSKEYKIGAFYMLLANLPPKYRSQLHVIQLVAFAKSQDIKMYGFETVLQPFIDDIKILESEGISVDRPEGNIRVFGSIIAVIADNLGAHSIGGFIESFITQRCCRFCFMTRNDMLQTIRCSEFPMRTKQMYDGQACLVENDASLAPVYGIKRSSTLNSLGHYHVVGGIPSDIAHDMFEGLVCEVMTNVIKYFVLCGFFSLEYLNSQINGLTYCTPDKRNKPSSVSQSVAKFVVKQSASQTWCFLRLLPVLIGAVVPQSDRKWKIILLLHDVIWYICSPTVTEGAVIFMKELIEEFFESYMEEFPNQNVKPKGHFLMHYPEQMIQFGPLIHLQTLRFEGKHSYFKQLAQRSNCRKNICKSMAQRHQYMQSLYNVNRDFLNGDSLETTGGVTVPIVLLQPCIQEMLSNYIHNEQTIYETDSLQYHGIKYCSDCCIVTGFQGTLYEFARVFQCYIASGIPLLLCRKLKTESYIGHFCMYAVKESNDYILLNVRDLKEAHPLGIYEIPNLNGKGIIMKYRVMF